MWLDNLALMVLDLTHFDSLETPIQGSLGKTNWRDEKHFPDVL